MRFDEEYFRARPYLMPSTATASNGVVYQPSSIRGQHLLVALAEDRAGRVGHSVPVHAIVSRRQARQRRLTDRDGASDALRRIRDPLSNTRPRQDDLLASLLKTLARVAGAVAE